MAKPNLTSIFTSSNQYSVLKLLKALCDAVDNIDYADNTEFTNFKEQVNTAVASLTSTDNSLQEQIDNNNGLINDVSTQVSVIERPDANTTVVNKGLTVKDNGDVTVSRNLEVGGTTKFNGGIKPILIKNSEYQTPEGIFSYKILDFGELVDSGRILGLINNDELELIGIGDYNISGTTNDYFEIYGVSMVNNDFEYVHLDNSEIGSEPIYETVAFMERTQSKLYRHIIKLGGGTLPDTYYGYIVYISTSNLTVASIQDLTTLTKAKAGFRYPLSGLCIQGAITGRPTATNYNVLGYDGSIWHVDSGDTTVDSPTITSVSDTVTPL